MLNFKFKCTHTLITSKLLHIKHYHIIFFIMSNFPYCYNEDFIEKKALTMSLVAPITLSAPMKNYLHSDPLKWESKKEVQKGR
jgi:hypothetical protein